MPTKIFLCWSGERSRLFAEALKDWLPQALGPEVEPAMSTQIEKGAEWYEELLKALDNAACGILCLTPEAMQSRWIHFESGLLVRALGRNQSAPAAGAADRRVFPLLHGVENGTLAEPLSSYQSTVVTDVDDVLRLLEALSRLIPGTETNEDSRKNWRRRWKELQKKLDTIPHVPLKEIVPDFDSLFRRKTFDERMYECLSQNWIDRYNGARDTQLKLKQHAATVRKACRPFVGDVYDEVVRVLDSYAMGLSKLIGRDEFPIDPQTGEVVFQNSGLAMACEKQRTKIRRLVARLVDEGLAPVLDEAFRFESAETFEEKKRLIHRKTAELESPTWAIDRAADSDWDFDRILFYLKEESGRQSLAESIDRTRMELEKIHAKTEARSLMALNYSLGPIERTVSLGGPSVDRAAAQQFEELSKDILAFIERSKSDTGAHVRTALTRIQKALSEKVAQAAKA